LTHILDREADDNIIRTHGDISWAKRRLKLQKNALSKDGDTIRVGVEPATDRPDTDARGISQNPISTVEGETSIKDLFGWDVWVIALHKGIFRWHFCHVRCRPAAD
jgi:hypothetical protein